MTQHSQFSIQTVAPKIRKVTFSNPPVNVVGADTVTQLVEVVDELSADEQVQVVIFDSATPGYFFNHADLDQVPELLALNSGDGTPTWVELVTRLTNAPFISIASIRGRTRGGGDEITLAFDLRYASREEAFFCQPEVAIGIVPGGGGSDRLARLLGRDRALEAILTSQDFDADTRRAVRMGDPDRARRRTRRPRDRRGSAHRLVRQAVRRRRQGTDQPGRPCRRRQICARPGRSSPNRSTGRDSKPACRSSARP